MGFAYSETSDIADLGGGAVYDVSRDVLYDAVLADGEAFETHVSDVRVNPEQTNQAPRDTIRVLCCGYYNSSVMQRAELEMAVMQKGETRTAYGPSYDVYLSGSGSSMLDLIYAAVLRRFDAVIDLRCFWPNARKSDAKLQLKEVAAALPICLGCGWTVTDADNQSWKTYKLTGAISMIAAPPAIHAELIEMVKPLIKKGKPASRGRSSRQA